MPGAFYFLSTHFTYKSWHTPVGPRIVFLCYHAYLEETKIISLVMGELNCEEPDRRRYLLMKRNNFLIWKIFWSWLIASSFRLPNIVSFGEFKVISIGFVTKIISSKGLLISTNVGITKDERWVWMSCSVPKGGILQVLPFDKFFVNSIIRTYRSLTNEVRFTCSNIN